MNTVTFSSQYNTNCNLTFNSLDGSQQVTINNITFPYEFIPSEHEVDDIYGTYNFNCGDCQYVREILPDTTSTSTTSTSTTSTSTTSTTTTSTTLPLFVCENENLILTIADGLVGEVISDTARDTSFTYNGVSLQVNVTPSTYQSGSNSYGVSFTVPSGYSNSGQIIECSVSAVGITTTTSTTSSTSTTSTTSTTLPTLTCEGITISLNDGDEGDIVTGTVDVGTIVGINPSTYVGGVNTYTVNVLPPQGYANENVKVECEASAIGITTTTSTTTESGGPEPTFCRFVEVDTTIEGPDMSRYGVRYIDSTGAIVQRTFNQSMGYDNGNSMIYGYCSSISINMVWDSITNTLVAAPFGVNFLADGGECTLDYCAWTPETPEFTCTDAGLNVSDGIYQQTVEATVNQGTIISISPSTYTSTLPRDYTVDILVPPGYSNSGQTIQCTDNAISETLDTFYLSGGQDVASVFCNEPGYEMSQTVYTVGASTISGALNKTLYTDQSLTNVFSYGPRGTSLEYAIYDSKKPDGTFYNTTEVSPLNGVTITDGVVGNVYSIDCSGGGTDPNDPLLTETTTTNDKNGGDFVDEEAPTGGEF